MGCDPDMLTLVTQCIDGKPPAGWHSPHTESDARVYGGDGLYIKILDVHGGWFNRARLFARVRRMLEKDAMMREAGFMAPEPVCAGKRKAAVYSVTREIAGMPIAVPRTLQPPEKYALMEALGKEVARMHASGIYHGDLNPYNVLFSSESGSYRFSFLDNAQNRRWFLFLRSRALSNLVRLNRQRRIWWVTARHRYLFLCAYLDALGRRGELRWWWRKLAKSYQRDLGRRAGRSGK